MTKSILVPIDVSTDDAGASAIAIAKDLAKLQDGRLILLNVVEQFTGYTSAFLPDDFYERAGKEAKSALQEIAQKHGISGATDLVVREGTPATEILSHAKEIKADVIVIPSHDPELADFFLGSVAARVVRHAHCSVMVVRGS